MSHWIVGALVILAAIASSTVTTTYGAATDMITAVNTTKPGCQRQCGNLTIPYPFGIGLGNGCSIGEWYDVHCNTSFNPPKPFLTNTSVEILEITEAHMKLKNWVAEACYDRQGITFLDLPNSSPFTFSETLNTFFATGCDTLAVIKASEGSNLTSGCLTLCSSKEDVIGGTCSGIGCCKTPIPKGMKGYAIGVVSLNNHTNISFFNPCSYAFLAETEKFTFQGVSDFLDPTFKNRTTNVPVVMDWNVGNGTTCDQAKQSSSSYACHENTNCTDVDLGSGGYRCSCLPGYEGNPYLTPGCKDVDECTGPSNPCIHKKTCKNTVGDYRCSCPKGHRGDGRTNGIGCASNNSQLALKIGLGMSVALLFIFICISWTYFNLRKRRLMKMREKFFEQNGGLLLKQQVGSNPGHNESTKIFSADELKLATNNYNEDRILGKGGYGTVYKGVLADNRVVAIKKSKVVILTQINHRNVVKLLGCCLESEVPLLVYEYVSNGTLFEHIHNRGSSPSWLNWGNCLRIASEVADALSYLHSAASIPIIHRDIKSANILIDDSYDAKVSDFGASRLIPLDQTQVSTLVQGTMGYLDPEYFHTSQLTEKSDVYSFGVLLAELVTREKPLCMERNMEERNLASYFQTATKEDRVLEIVHTDIIREADQEQMLYVAKLISSCLSINGDDRPTMKEVAIELEGLKKNMKHRRIERSNEEINTSLTGRVEEDLYPLNLHSHTSSIVDSDQFNSIQNHMLIKMNHPPALGATDMVTTVNTTKPGCQRQCGNLTVPYPFGIGLDNGCSLGEWYVVRCNTIFSPPKAFLSTTQAEIKEISEAHIELKNSVAQSCSSIGSVSLRLQGSSPFTISDTQNSFFATGCDSLAFVSSTQGTNITVGCLALCSKKEDVIEGKCSGIGCCRTPVPKGLKRYTILVTAGGFNPINVSSFRTTCNQAKQSSSSSYTCDVEFGSKGYRCSCLSGYEGNPYLTSGCKDVDECVGPSNPCIHNKTCRNLVGDYQCSCPKDHHGDGRLNGIGCVFNNSQLEMKIGLGVSISLLFVLVCISWIYFTIRKRRLVKMREKFFEQNGGFLLKQQTGSNNESTKIFSVDELKLATNNYSKDNILGEGGYGTVYKGVLADNRVVTIKKFKVSDQTQIEQFINEVVILTQVNHRNVVKLLGCCLESQVPLLVYEYVSNGTPMGHIRNNGSVASWLTWPNCVRIASEAADALSYLHSSTNKPIFHRDIKSANILIDDSYVAKIADFGASRLIPLNQTRVSTTVQGTMCYLDPKYFHTGQLTKKSDVYSFGVLLAELMTREKPLCMLRKMEERNLACCFLLAMKENRVIEIVHADLTRVLVKKAMIGRQMKEVAMELEGLKKHIKHPCAKDNHEDSSSFVASPQGDLYPINSRIYVTFATDFGQQNSILREMLIKANNPRSYCII
ncbi:hypothetical protein V2J09_001391 [Rumex salicifolius]